MAGLGGIMALSLELAIDETLRLLLAMLIVTAFYALMTWRLLDERELSLDRIRPFVASRQLSASLLDPVVTSRDGGVAEPGDIRWSGRSAPSATSYWERGSASQGRRRAARTANRAATLAPGCRPDGARWAPRRDRRSDRHPRGCLTTRPPLRLPLDPSDFSGASWAVSLWNGPGLSGLLLLGEKRDGSLYTEEEIEIARETRRAPDRRAGHGRACSPPADRAATTDGRGADPRSHRAARHSTTTCCRCCTQLPARGGQRQHQRPPRRLALRPPS